MMVDGEWIGVDGGSQRAHMDGRRQDTIGHDRTREVCRSERVGKVKVKVKVVWTEVDQDIDPRTRCGGVCLCVCGGVVGRDGACCTLLSALAWSKVGSRVHDGDEGDEAEGKGRDDG
jgi:hypothetical protein